jgi:hypothetical protein
VESKEIDLIEIESKMVVANGQREKENIGKG